MTMVMAVVMRKKQWAMGKNKVMVQLHPMVSMMPPMIHICCTNYKTDLGPHFM